MKIRGFSLLEMALALGISGVVLGGAWQLMNTTGKQTEAAGLANHALAVARATSDYLTSNRTAILTQLPDLTTNSVTRIKVTSTDTGNATLTDLQTYGALNSTFVNQNSYAQTYAVYVKRQDGGPAGVDGSDRLIGLVLTTGGQAISDAMGNAIAGRIGAAGGFIFSDDNPAYPTAATTIRGTAGGWTLTSLSSTAGWSTIGTVATVGHIAVLTNMLAPGAASSGSSVMAIDDLTDGRTDYGTDLNLFMGNNAGAAIASGGQNNTGVGISALAATTTGDNNTAFGMNALAANTTAGSNTAFGYNALAANTTGSINLAIGDSALRNNTTGSRNIAIGNYRNITGVGGTLETNSTGNKNVAIGSAVMAKNTTGYSNVAIGESDDWEATMRDNTTGSENVAIGPSALQANSTSSWNVAIGSKACASCTSSHNIALGSNVMSAGGSSGVANVGIGTTALYANTTGYQNVAIGSGDNWDGALKSNTTGYQNAALGWAALTLNTVGSKNVAVGTQSLSSSVVASESTAVGYGAMYWMNGDSASVPFVSYNTAVGAYALRGSNSPASNSGIHNTAIGHYSLTRTDTGSYNTAIGSQAMAYNSGGNFNIAIGYRALFNSLTASANVAIGTESAASNKAALEDLTYGVRNVAVGASAMTTTTRRGENTAVGYEAMRFADDTAVLAATNNTALGAYALRGSVTPSNNTGTDNTAVGHNALKSNRAGSYNTAVGSDAAEAGTNNTNGNYNTWIGYQAQSNGNSYNNSTALGNGATITGSNEIVLGNSAITTLRANTATISALSDGRHKHDVKEMDLGLNFINSLKPVEYRFTNGDETLRFGLIAQDLAAVLPEPYKAMAQKKTGGVALLSRDENEERTYRLGYAELTAPMLKAIQELSGTVKEQRVIIRQLQEEIARLQQAQQPQQGTAQ